MADNLENNLNEEAEYNLTDLLIPLKGTRHIPQIMKMKDFREKCYELGMNLFVVACQASVYYNLYELLKDK